MVARKKAAPARRPARRRGTARAAGDLLQRYTEKRRFDVTPEPRGKPGARSRGDSFVIQQHDATRTHWDFRLELDGVLKSWAIPKGPSLSVQEKRLAVQTEDHPLDYRDFEGYIPEGEYGGGPVIVWDRGRWTPEGDPHEGMEKGSLAFSLEGEKLQGRFTLVRLKGRGREPASGPKSHWLLIKRSDEFAREGTDAEVTRHLTHSVISDRTVQEVGAGVTAKPRKAAAARPAQRPAKRPARGKAAAMPALDSLSPQLATLVDRPTADAGWVYEMKFDGYRLLVATGAKVQLRSRNRQDWTAKLPTIVRALQHIKASAILDGELCYVSDDGLTHFQMLQNAIGMGERIDPKRLVLYLFDLLYCDGEDWRTQPLLARKQRLETLLRPLKQPAVQYSPHVEGDARTIFSQACELGFEGVIGKRRDAPYREGRGTQWLKLKCNKRQEFVIVGFLRSQARAGFRSLLLASRDDGRLRYNGKVGTGFDTRTIADIARRLQALIVDKPAFAGAPALRDAVWVQPRLVCEVSYTEMTRDGSLRHPSFEGLRIDKPAAEVVREEPVAVSKAVSKAAPKARARTAAGPSVAGVHISHPERVLDPVSGVTKLQLAQYHERLHERFLVYAAERPLALVRCPQGNAQDCFFQKNRMAGLGADVITLDVGGKDALAVNSPAGILQLVQFNVVEMHGWGCRMPRHDQPDWIVFDLDPGEGLAFGEVIDAAQELRDLLAAMKLGSFVKTTGGKGLHVVVPLQPKAGWDEVKSFSRHVAVALARIAPTRYVATMAKTQRKNRIFVDYLRNAPGNTAILPYSPRTRPGMTVAVPLDWKELKGVDPKAFTVRDAASWLKGRRDPWARLWDGAPALPDLTEVLQRAR